MVAGTYFATKITTYWGAGNTTPANDKTPQYFMWVIEDPRPWPNGRGPAAWMLGSSLKNTYPYYSAVHGPGSLKDFGATPTSITIYEFFTSPDGGITNTGKVTVFEKQ
jgi:hypothetical protein